MIILCAIYSPPNSRKKSKLIDFISNNYNQLKSSKYPSAYFCLGGDINDLKIDLLLNISPKFRQIVKLPTRGTKILDVIVTDLWEFYQEPIILPPLLPDVIGVGSPSDHSVPFAQKYTDRRILRKPNYIKKAIRPFPDSGILEFGRWIQNKDFTEVIETVSTTEKVKALDHILSSKVNDIFPEKIVKIYHQDKEWMNSELRILRRQKSREYYKHKKSEKFRDLELKYQKIKYQNTQRYIQNEIESLKSLNIKDFFRKIKKIGAKTGEAVNETFTLSSHVEDKLSPTEAAEHIAKHFSSISKEFPPINTNSLPHRVKEKIFHPEVSKGCPFIEEYQVYENFKRGGQKSCTVPGDFPNKLKNEFAPELAGPVADIFNSITKSGIYPRQWVTEYVTPIPKISPPESEDDLRNISLTANLSKHYENFLAAWLLPYIKKRIDPGQYGGLRGHSTSHYLIQLYDFILSHTDNSRIPKAVIVALVDFSKAFNRIEHSKVITRLSD